MINRKLFKPVMLASVAALAISSFAVVAAVDTAGTADVNGGDLSMTVPATHHFGGVTLNGHDQTINQPWGLLFDVSDARGSGAGWNIDITSTTFTNAALDTLPTTAFKVARMDTVLMSGTDAVNSIPYPLTVPAGAVAPTAVKLFNAAVDTGMGNIHVWPEFTIDIPAATYAGTYSSTITTTISTGP